jgi:hypothetical protein
LGVAITRPTADRPTTVIPDKRSAVSGMTAAAVLFSPVDNFRAQPCVLVLFLACFSLDRERSATMTDDPIMSDIMAAIAVLQRGNRAGGRRELEAVWARIADNPEPIHVCTLAHYMADAQDNPADELAWDLRALDAALSCTDDDAQRHSQVQTIAAFLPSLHLNLAEDYLKLGDMMRATHHLASARIFTDRLADDGYGRMIRGGIRRIATRLEATSG